MTKQSTVSSPEAIRRQLYSELFPKELTKSEKRRLEIIEGAIKAFARMDFESVSFDDVAGPAKTSRRLVQHYFPTKEDLFITVMKMVRGQYQALVIEAISKVSTPQVQFTEYIRAAINWVELQPLHFRTWILFYLVCANRRDQRKLHEQMADIGEERIIAMISAIPANRDRSTTDLKFAAKTIQRLIAGTLIEIASERVAPNIAVIREQTVRACQAIVDALK